VDRRAIKEPDRIFDQFSKGIISINMLISIKCLWFHRVLFCDSCDVSAVASWMNCQAYKNEVAPVHLPASQTMSASIMHTLCDERIVLDENRFEP